MDKDHSIFKLTERLLGARACHSSLCPILERNGADISCQHYAPSSQTEINHTGHISLGPCSYITVSWIFLDFGQDI